MSIEGASKEDTDECIYGAPKEHQGRTKEDHQRIIKGAAKEQQRSINAA
jgi:hypothetical protein